MKLSEFLKYLSASSPIMVEYVIPTGVEKPKGMRTLVSFSSSAELGKMIDNKYIYDANVSLVFPTVFGVYDGVMCKVPESHRNNGTPGDYVYVNYVEDF